VNETYAVDQVIHRIEDDFKNNFVIKKINKMVYIHDRGAFDSAKNHKRQRRKRQSVTAK